MKKLLLLCFVLLLSGCSKDNLEQIEEGQVPETKSTTKNAGTTVFENSNFGTPLTLGEKRENPYSLKNVRKAALSKTKQARGLSLPESEIAPTHRYIRFLPSNTNEYTLLLKTVRSFPFPLDREIVTNGTFYRDPDPTNEGKIYSWQYAVVPVEQQLPDVMYEILDELYMPENKDGKNNLTKLGPPGRNTVTVRVWDSSTSFNRFVPVKGLMVNAVDLDKGASIAYGITDETGTAIMNTSFPVTESTFYCIFWNDGIGWKWITTDANSNQLFYNVKAVVGTTYIDIENTREHEMIEQSLATIHRAAYRTYYKTNSDLLPPANNETIQIAYDDTHSPENHGGLCYGYTPGVSKINVRIYGRASDGGNLYPPKVIFSTTAHELGHLNHNVGFPAAFSSDKIIIESWARCVQKYLTQYEYEEYGLSLFKTELLPYLGAPGPPGQTVKKEFVVPNSLNCQKWPFIFSDNILAEISQKELPYSPIFIDLIDDENQRQYFQGLYIQNNNPTTDYYLRFPLDNVKNFTIGELQGLLKNTYTLEQLREKVKGLSNLHGNSVSSINTVFSKYIEYWNLYVPSKSANGQTGPDGSNVIVD